MNRTLFLIVILLGGSAASAQESPEPHRLPFASQGNTLELAVANTSADAALEGVSVRLETSPEWLTFSSDQNQFAAIASGEEAVAAFTFDVDRNAPVGEATEVVFHIESAAGVLSTKTIYLEVEAPRTFSLSPNYPNPFNPTTTLAFELPQASRVSLNIYDVLGREIVALAEGDFEPGRHEVVFDARSVASGLYIARIVAETEDGSVTSRIRRMTLLK